MFRRKKKEQTDPRPDHIDGDLRLRFKRVPRKRGVELQVSVERYSRYWAPLTSQAAFGEDAEALIDAIKAVEGVVFVNEFAASTSEAAIVREFEKWRDLQYQQRAAEWYDAPAREAESGVGREMALPHYNGDPLVIGHRTMLPKAMLMDMAMSPEALAELVSADWREGIVRTVQNYRAEQYGKEPGV